MTGEGIHVHARVFQSGVLLNHDNIMQMYQFLSNKCGTNICLLNDEVKMLYLRIRFTQGLGFQQILYKFNTWIQKNEKNKCYKQISILIAMFCLFKKDMLRLRQIFFKTEEILTFFILKKILRSHVVAKIQFLRVFFGIVLQVL